MLPKVNRRTFNRAGAVTAMGLTALQTSRALGANDRIRLGVIGVANRGGQLINAFLHHDDMEIVAICDVAQSTLDKMRDKLSKRNDKPEKAGGKAPPPAVAPRTYHDFRKLIDQKDIDAVVIATPDHWHPIMTITACRAGKDVYVEKPISYTIHEGRRMVQVARETKRVVQVGTHRRSGNIYKQAVDLVQGGKIGKVTVARSYHRSNMYPNGIGHAKPTAPPPDLDWDMWLGPRPSRPFQATIAPYKFRWWKEYCSQISNNGVHSLDLIRWMMGTKGPVSVCCMGGKFAVDDDRTIPDTAMTVFEYPEGWLSMFGMFEANGYQTNARSGWNVELRGTQGVLFATDSQYEIAPERGGQFQKPAPRMEPVKVKSTDGNMTVQHTRNFLDCIRSRAVPNADIEEGHRSTTLALLSKISLAVGQRIEWDLEQERITNLPEANSLLHYEYRKPWKLD